MKKNLSENTPIRLSRYAHPRVLNGDTYFYPTNLTEGPDRIGYLEGLVSYANSLLEIEKKKKSKGDLKGLALFLIHLPFFSSLAYLEKKGKNIVCHEKENARDYLSLNRENISVAIMDGRDRRVETTCTFVAGRSVSDLGVILRLLAHGTTSRALRKIAKKRRISGINLIVDELTSKNLIEKYEPNFNPSVKTHFIVDERDSLTWMGHAGVVFKGGKTTIWVDPVMRPKIQWTPQDRAKLFSKDFADSLMMINYKEAPGPLHYSEFSAPDAVCITHQDIDHFDMGTLLLIPENIPIIVPKSSDSPWDVDLKSVLHGILGPRRKVIALGHNETIKIGSVSITAFPFVGEIGASLLHQWNCYFLESKKSAVACTADSVIGKEALDFLIRKMSRSDKKLLLCCRAPHDGRVRPGYRDDDTSHHSFYNGSRLWQWRVPVGDLFYPSEGLGPNMTTLRKLYRLAKLRSYFSYAAGSTPWFRIEGADDIFEILVGHLTKREHLKTKAQLKSVGKSITFFPAKYGCPVGIE